MNNQNPEQIARDHIDRQLIASGWIIQDKKKINLNAGLGIAIKEYSTDIGPADYIFDKKALLERQQLYEELAKKIWDINKLNEQLN